MILFLACTGSIDDTHSKMTDTSIPIENLHNLSTFASWITESKGYATGLATADFNQDQWMDIVISYGNDMDEGPIEIYLNDNGVLPQDPSWTSYHTAFYAHISTGDLNGDGYPDIVASRYIGSSDFLEPGGIDIYINQNGHFFATPDQQYDGLYTFGNALGDIDNDGDLDLAIATGEVYTQQQQSVEIWKNKNGYFEPFWTQNTTGYAYDVCFGDVNSDGFVDLFVVQNKSPHCWYLSTGTTINSEPDRCSEPPASELGNRCVVGHFNSNETLDWMVSNTAQAQNDVEQGFVDLWLDGDLVWQSDISDMYSGIAVWTSEEQSNVFISSWWGDIVGYEWKEDHMQEFWRTYNDDIVSEELLLFSPQAITQTISGQGFYSLPLNSLVLSVQGGVFTSNQIYSSGNWTATIIISEKPSLFVSNWDPNVGSLGYFPLE